MLEHRQLEGAPVPPAEFGPEYNSYVTDPLFGRRFTYVWVAGTVAFTILYLPHLYRSLRTGRIWQGWALYENPVTGYRPLDDADVNEKFRAPTQPILHPNSAGSRRSTRTHSLLAFLKGSVDWVQLRMAKYTNLDIGQIAVLAAYLTTLIVCVVYQAPLATNSNRAGFLSLAQLPFVFLYASKSSPTTFLLGRGYEKLNFLHRWAGRALFLTATIHGSLWIRFHIISGQRELLITGEKEKRGQATYALLGLVVLTSLLPVRRWGYNLFFAAHIVLVTTFFVSLCYHTPYAVPWIVPPVSFYAFDLLVRLVRMRFKDAYLEAPDSQMTLIRIPDVSGGWIAGQHVRLRVFFKGYLLESHPLSICNAPPSITNFKASNFGKSPTTKEASLGMRLGEGGILLAAKNCGDWSAALNALARSDLPEDKGALMSLLRSTRQSDGEFQSEQTHADVEDDHLNYAAVNVMIDGPYGGSSVDFAACENVVMISGGSGVTFALGLLDDLVGRIANERRDGQRPLGQSLTTTRRVLFVWCVKSYGSVGWFSRQFATIARVAADPSLNLRLDFRFFVTCYCNPEEVHPHIRNSEIVQTKPVVSEIIDEFVGEVLQEQSSGGFGVAASGPERLTTVTRNAVAKIGPLKARQLGGVELHTEAYTL
ncbi:hypothetical protein FRB99_002267 [Tulasnella sp. 403]|nr:hypothetical protein FRB99_002267 [Tulasnella sp. 403]